MARDDRKRFLGMPYDWRRPTIERFKKHAWNAQDSRVFTPKWFGWGYTINLRALGRRIGRRRHS